MNKSGSTSNMANNGLPQQSYQKRRKSSHEFLQKLISVEQNFSVFRYSDYNQGGTDYNTTSSSFYPVQKQQGGGIFRVSPQNIQNTEMISNLYLLPQSLSNKKSSLHDSNFKKHVSMNLNKYSTDKIANNSSYFENKGKTADTSNQAQNNAQNSTIYHIQIPSIQCRDDSRKLSSKALNQLYFQSQPKSSLNGQSSQDNQKSSYISFSKKHTQNAISDKIMTTNNTTKQSCYVQEGNSGNERNNLIPLNCERNYQKQFQNKFNHSASRSLEINKDDIEKGDNLNIIQKRRDSKSFSRIPQKLSKDVNQSQDNAEAEKEVAQQKFNEIMTTLRYGKIKEHKLRIFRQMKNSGNSSSNVYQFHSQRQGVNQIDNQPQNDKDTRNQSKSPRQKSKGFNSSSMETFFTTKQDNTVLKNQQVTQSGDEVLKQEILQKKKLQHKQDCSDQKFQNFFKKLVTLDKVLKPSTVTSNKEPNQMPKQYLSEIQAISKQLNGTNPQIYNPFNTTYFKEKHIFSKKIESGEQDQKSRIENVEDNQIINEEYEPQKQEVKQSVIEKDRWKCRSSSPIAKNPNKVNFFPKGINKQSVHQQNKDKDVAQILCKYINSNRNYLSYEPNTLLKPPHSNMNTPINLSSYQFLQKFLPNFNTVERHFAYSESNLQKNQLVLEKVLLERIIKQEDGSKTQILDDELNKKSDLLFQPTGKDYAAAPPGNRNLYFSIR